MKYTKLSRCCVVTMRFYEVVRKLGACGAMLVPVVADIVRPVVVEVRVARCCCVVRRLRHRWPKFYSNWQSFSECKSLKMFSKWGVDDINAGGRKYWSSVAVLKSKGLCYAAHLCYKFFYKSFHFKHLSSLSCATIFNQFCGHRVLVISLKSNSLKISTISW